MEIIILIYSLINDAEKRFTVQNCYRESGLQMYSTNPKPASLGHKKMSMM